MDTTVADPLVGQLLDGRYRVESRIAGGGMATVYMARDLKLDRVIALKVMHAALARDEDFVRRFMGEAVAAAGLSHPNVVAVFDQGTDGQHVFLAMEYVAGRTLREQLEERGRLGPRAALEILQPVLAALAAAHRAGLVHRDVKPENVLLTGDGQVKVADFGLARAETASKQTKTGMIIGTVGYLAPEQVLTGNADVRSDVYAVGIMLFELLTGRLPHQGDTPLAVAYKHVNDVVPPPSGLVPGLPPQLDALVTLATSHDPARRPQDAGRFLAATAEVLAALPPDIDQRMAGQLRQTATALAQPPAPPRGGQTRILQPGAMPPPGMPGAPGPYRPGPPQGTAMDRLIGAVTGRWVLIAIAALAAVILGWAVWYQTAGQYEHVPDNVIGMSLRDAKRDLAGKGLVVREGRDVYSDAVRKGQVAKTDPPPGSRLAQGDTVTLYESKGRRPVEVPDTTGKSVEEAKGILRDKGFSVREVTKSSSQTVEKGRVVRTDPPAGDESSPDDPVDLVVSSGMPMPDLVGENAREAQKVLRAMGLEVKVEKQEDGGKPFNTVLSQDPAPDKGVSRGDEVTLVVNQRDCEWYDFGCFLDNNGNNGADPNALPVPNTLGQDVHDAEKALRNSGFQVQVEEQVGTGRVLRQEPASGTLPRGSTVTIWH